MKKIIVLLIFPLLLYSIEAKKKSGTSKSSEEELKSEKIYKVKRDTLDRDGDGITDKFFKRLRDKEGKIFSPYREEIRDDKREIQKQRKIPERKSKSRLR